MIHIRKIINHPHFIPWILFIVFTTIYFSSTVGGMNSLDGSQYSLTQALVEEHTFKIDSFMKWTYNVDYSLSNHHFYADRDPGLSFLAIPFYWLAKNIYIFANKPYGNINIDTDSIIQALTYITSAIICALGLLAFYQSSLYFVKSKKIAFFTAFIGGLGTLMWKYSSGFYREPVFTSLLFISFYFLFISEKYSFNDRKKILFLSGMIVAISIFVDYSKVFILPIYYLFLVLNKEIKRQLIIYFSAGLVIFILLIIFYNISAFNNIFANPHAYHAYLKWMRIPINIFQTPLISSLVTNLFSNSPIQRNILSFFWKNPDISYQMGAEWATIWTYKGIFIQSPILIFAILGWIEFVKKFTHKALLLLAIGIINLLINAKLTVFWAGNNYDTKYFLPTVLIFLLGLIFIANKLNKKRINIYQYLIFIIIFILSIISLYNGWYSTLTSFAPHVSGEHRFTFEQLQQPVFALTNIKTNL